MTTTTTDGTLWYADTDSIGTYNTSNTNPSTVYDHTTANYTFNGVALDTTSNVWFGLGQSNGQSAIFDGSIANGTGSAPPYYQPTPAGLTFNAITVDMADHLIFATGTSQGGPAGIYEIGYVPSSLYFTSSSFTATNVSGLQNPTSTYFDGSTGTLYVVDATAPNGVPNGGHATDGIYAYTVSSGGGLTPATFADPATNGTTNELTSDSQFLNGAASGENAFPNGVITAVVSDNNANGYVYFLTESAAQADGGTAGDGEDQIWYVKKGAGLQTAQTLQLPNGTTFGSFAGPHGVDGLTFDQAGNQGMGALYVTDQQSGEIVQINLSRTGAYATSVGNFLQDTNGVGGLAFIDGAHTGPGISVSTAGQSYIGASPAITPLAGLQLTDSNNITSASVYVDGGYAGDGVTLSLSNTQGLTESVAYNGTSEEVVTFTGSAPASLYQQVLASLQFQTSVPDPTNKGADPTRSTSLVATDSNGVSYTAAGPTLDLQALTPPTLSNFNGTSTVALQGGAAVTLLTSTPSIVSAANLQSVTVAIASPQSGDELIVSQSTSNAGTSAGITISGSGTSSLSLSGPASAAAYASILSQIEYEDASTANATGPGTHPQRTIDWTATNAAGSATSPATSTITIDRPPTIVTHNVVANSLQSTSGNAGDTDPDGDGISVSGVAHGANSGSVGQALQGAYGSLVLNADDSYTYTPNASEIAAATTTGSHLVDTFSYTIGDPSGLTSTETLNFVIDRPPAGVNQTVSVMALQTEAVAAGQGATATTGAAALVGVTDPDTAATHFSITAAGTSSASQSVSTQSGATVTGTYGVLTIHADGSYTYNAATTSTEQQALASAAQGSHPTDVFTLAIGDTDGPSQGTETLTFSYDRAPTIASLGTSISATAGGPAVKLSPTLSVTDPDGGQITGATVTIQNAQVGDVLSATSTNLVSASYAIVEGANGTETGVLTLAPQSGATPTSANYESALQTVALQAGGNVDAADYNSGGAMRTISWQATDNAGATTSASSSVETVNVTGEAFADTAANVAASLDSLETNVSTLKSVQITDNQPLVITAAQATADSQVLSKIIGAYELQATGVTGQAYTGYTQDFNANGHLTDETLSGYTNAPYTTLVQTFDSSGRVLTQTYENSSGAAVESASVSYNADGSYIKTVAGVTGEPYTGYSQSYNAAGALVGETLTGLSSSTYGYTSIAETFNSDGSASATYAGVAGQAYTSYSQSYNAQGHLTTETLSGYSQAQYGYSSVTDSFNTSGQVVGQLLEDGSGNVLQSIAVNYNGDGSYSETVQGVKGQPYTGYTQTFTSTGHMTGETLMGYSQSTYGYTTVADIFDGQNRLVNQTYTTSTGSVVQNVATAYNNDGSYAVTYSQLHSGPFSAYTQDYDAGAHLLSEQVTNLDGSRSDYAFANGQTFLSTSAVQSQNAIGTGETFVIGTGFSSVTLNGYEPGADSIDIASSLSSSFGQLMTHASADGSDATQFSFAPHESFVVLGVTIAQLDAHQSDFHFV